MKVFDATLETLQRALDVRLARHNVLAGNLANANTPGFVPRDVDFAAALRQRSLEAEPALPVPRETMTFSRTLPLDAAGAGVPAPRAATRGADIPLYGEAGGSAGGALPMVTAPTAGAGLDGNAVDVDRALTAVAENAIQYGAAARAAQKKLAILRYAATDGVG